MHEMKLHQQSSIALFFDHHSDFECVLAPRFPVMGATPVEDPETPDTPTLPKSPERPVDPVEPIPIIAPDERPEDCPCPGTPTCPVDSLQYEYVGWKYVSRS